MGYINSNGDYIPNTYLDRHNSWDHHHGHSGHHHGSGHHRDYITDIFLPSHLLLIFIGLIVFFSTILIITRSK